ncbi:MAG TPA: hypothetical protein VNO33_13565, partial [Kofleriaceae bacterium]|nr:hypothetical protein [Kofleriaceae bacterium]
AIAPPDSAVPGAALVAEPAREPDRSTPEPVQVTRARRADPPAQTPARVRREKAAPERAVPERAKADRAVADRAIVDRAPARPARPALADADRPPSPAVAGAVRTERTDPLIPLAAPEPQPSRVLARRPSQQAPGGRTALVPEPRLLRMVIDDISVEGSLGDAEVRRGIDRVQPRLRGCYRGATGRGSGVRVSFTVDENGRARDIRISGGQTPGLSSCITQVFGAVRTRVAPDVGEVRVTLRVGLAPVEPR